MYTFVIRWNSVCLKNLGVYTTSLQETYFLILCFPLTPLKSFSCLKNPSRNIKNGDISAGFNFLIEFCKIEEAQL